MQNGQIIRSANGKKWYLRYYTGVITDGKRERTSVFIADYNDQYRNESQVEKHPKVAAILRPVAGQAQPGELTMAQFIETIYLPYVEANKRPSTAKGYRNLYNGKKGGGFRQYLNGTPLKEFGVPAAQRVIEAYKAAKNPTTVTLIHIKAFMVSAIWHAMRKGFFGENYTGSNPLAGESLDLTARPSSSTHAYTFEEITAMLEAIHNQTYKDLMVTAAFTGLRASEIRGLRWQDINFETNVLNVEQSYWGNKGPQPTKTTSSRAAIPMIPQLAVVLKARRKENPDTKYVFEGIHMTPLDIESIGSKKIKPALKKVGQTWYGWHAYRRGLATLLRDLGEAMETTSAIMRHSNIGITMKLYAKPSAKVNAAAMARFSEAIKGH